MGGQPSLHEQTSPAPRPRGDSPGREADTAQGRDGPADPRRPGHSCEQPGLHWS